jgi:DNA polymerase III sliding clamp (beta) subunit (PCNA family)
MNVTVETKVLREALSVVAPAVPKGSVTPALLCARVRLAPWASGNPAYPQMLEICCTGLDARMEVQIPCRTHENKAQDVLLPMITAMPLVKLMHQEQIRISKVADTQVMLAAEDLEYCLDTPNPEDFPAGMTTVRCFYDNDAPPPKPTPTVSLTAEEWIKLLRGTRYAVAGNKESRYVLQSILFEFQDETLRLVSSDGKRLALVNKKIDRTTPGIVRYVVPELAADLLIHSLMLATRKNSMVHLTLGNDHVVMECSECRGVEALSLKAKLIDYQYPDYSKLLKGTTVKARLTVNRSDLLRAVQRASLMARDPLAFGIFMSFDHTIAIRSAGHMYGRASERVKTLSYEGEKREVRLNHQYVLDYLDVTDDETIRIEVCEDTRPILFADSQNQQCCYIMPLINNV